MNVEELKDRIFRATRGQFTDFTYMLQLLNDALTDMADEAKLEDSFTIHVVKDQDTYTLPDNFKSIRSLIDETTVTDFYQTYPLIDITENKFGCVVFNNDLIIRPTPTQDVELTLYYYKFPDDLTNDADVPGIDPQYHNLLSTYAIMMILPMIQGVNPNQIQQYTNMWNAGKQQFIVEMQKKRKLTKVREPITW